MTVMTLPLFPLTTILFPDGRLPLQIFELRYLTMIKQCIAQRSAFGVVAQTVPRQPPQGGTTANTLTEPMSQETFTATGTTATVVWHAVAQPGLMRINCVGGQRFSIQRTQQQKLGLWTAEVLPIAADLLIPVPDELADTVTALRQVIATLTLQATEVSQMPIAQPYKFDDCGWVANRWCELIPMQPAQRQRLLVLENPLIRLELVQDLLETGGFLR